MTFPSGTVHRQHLVGVVLGWSDLVIYLPQFFPLANEVVGCS